MKNKLDKQFLHIIDKLQKIASDLEEKNQEHLKYLDILQKTIEINEKKLKEVVARNDNSKSKLVTLKKKYKKIN